MHFIHIPSPLPNAVPLLLLPSFPLTNLSLAPIFGKLTEPGDGGQAYHIVVPSLPGLGFSDALLTEGEPLATTAKMLGELMKRLGYVVWLASSTGNGRSGVGAGIDVDGVLARLLGEEEGCLGVHIIDPVVERPRAATQFAGWLKFNVARFFHAEVWGYEKQDFLSLRRRGVGATKLGLGLGMGWGMGQPNTLSYALCDSPVGLLSFVCAGLRRMDPNHGLTKLEVVDLTQLAWLPGPEAGMRFLYAAQKEIVALQDVKTTKGKARRSRVAVTVFNDLADDESYTCPAWLSLHHDVVFTQRLPGLPGPIALHKHDIMLEGIRGLTEAVRKLDGRLAVQALEQVVVHVDVGEEEVDDGAVVEVRELSSVDLDEDWDSVIEEEEEEGVMQLDVESPDTVVGLGERR